jgi:hypothetical protein
MSFQWSPLLVKIFLDCVLSEVRKGNTAEGGFKKQQWTCITEAFRNHSGLAPDKQILQNKLVQLKKKFAIFKALKSNSGFGWDDALKVPTAPDAVWISYLAVHKEAREFRRKSLEYFDELDEIFAGNIATGSHSLSSISSGLQAFQIRAEGVPAEEEADEFIFHSSQPTSRNSTPHMIGRASSSQSTPAITQTPVLIQMEKTIEEEENHRLLTTTSSSMISRKRGRRDGIAEAIIEAVKERRAPSVAATCSQQNAVQQAIKQFRDRFADQFCLEDRVALKVYLAENPTQANLFLVMEEDEDEQLCYLKTRLQKLAT